MKNIQLPLLAIALFGHCAPRTETPINPPVSISVHDLLVGLWSKDSSGLLTNSGFLLMADGSCFECGGGLNGAWSSNSSDSSFQIIWTTPSVDTTDYRINSLETERLVAESEGISANYRKVPIGFSQEPVVISGFAGNLNNLRPERQYPLMLPSAKLIELKLESDDSAIGFQLFDAKGNLSPPNQKTWKGAVIDPNGVRLIVSHSKPTALDKAGHDYDLKVFGY